MLAIISVICLQVSFNVSSSVLLTQKGVDELQKIKGYVKFIKEYSLIKDTSRQSIIIWNQYLTYCIALNLTEKINKDLKKILGEELYIDKVIYD